MNVAPLAKVVDLIADNVAGLDPLLFVDGKPAPNPDPVFRFLASPGFNRTRRRLIKELVIQELVTGTAYMAVYGQTQSDPASIDVFKSFFVSPMFSGDMWPGSYMYAEGNRSERFYRIGSRDYRWIGESGLSEICPIYGMDGNYRGVGLPRLSAVKLDVELRLKGAEHNAATMHNGAKLSGVLNSKTGLTPDQHASLMEQVRSTLTGVGNAGRVLITGGGEMQFTPLSLTPKDMDWANLQRSVEDSIATRFNVPATLFNNEAQTDNNYETAWHMFYDNAVLPVFDVVWSGIGRMFSDRFGREISFKHNTITNNILFRQASARAIDLYKSGLTSMNEARTTIGYEPVYGGDVVVNPANGQIAQDYFTDDELPIRALPSPSEVRSDGRDSNRNDEPSSH